MTTLVTTKVTGRNLAYDTISSSEETYTISSSEETYHFALINNLHSIQVCFKPRSGQTSRNCRETDATYS